MRSVAAFLRALAPIVFLGAAACSTLLGGCGRVLPDVIDETASWSADRLYSESKNAMADGSYDKAIKYFEKLEARFPYGRYAQQAQLEVAYAYFRQAERASAIAACDRFIRLHPNHPNVDYAYYKARESESALDAADTFIRENPTHPRVDYAWYVKGLVDFERSPNFLEVCLAVPLANRTRIH